MIVRLRGLQINGAGTTLGVNGIRWLAGAGQLHVERVLIMNSSTKGIDFLPTAGTAELYVIDSHISEVGGTAGANAGIFIKPAGANARAFISRTSMTNNATGLFADSTGGVGNVRVNVTNSLAAGNANVGILANSGPALRLTIDRTTVAGNSTGVLSQGAGSATQIAHSVVTQNTTGLQTAAGGTLTSFASSILSGNDTDTSGTITTVSVQ